MDDQNDFGSDDKDKRSANLRSKAGRKKNLRQKKSHCRCSGFLRFEGRLVAAGFLLKQLQYQLRCCVSLSQHRSARLRQHLSLR